MSNSALGWTIFVFTASLAITLGVFLHVISRRWVQGVGIYAVVTLAEALWILGNIFELLSTRLTTKLFWDNAQFFPIGIVIIGLLTFSLLYQQSRPHFLLARVGVPGAVLVTLILLAITNGLRGGLRPGAHLIQSYGLIQLNYPFSVYDYAVFAFGYLLVLTGIYRLVRVAIRQPALLQPQTYLLIAGYCLPLLGSIFSLSNVQLGPQRDASPIYFAVGNLLIWLGLFHFRLFNILPSARITAVEHIHDGLIIFDKSDLLLDINPAAQAMLGLTLRDVIGLPAQQILPADIALAEYPPDERARRDIRLPAPNGNPAEPLQYELSHVLILSQRNRSIGRMLVLHDVTAHKTGEEIQRQAREERILRHSEAKFHMVIEQFAEGFVLVDTHGMINEWNPAQAAMTGIPRAVAIGRPFWEIMDLLTLPEKKSPERDAFFRKTVFDTIYTGQIGMKPVIEATIQCADGQRKHIQQVTFSVKIDDEFWVGSSMRDISAQKEAQIALEQYLARLKILHAIDRSVLTAERPAEVVANTFKNMQPYIPFHCAGVTLLNPQPDGIQFLTENGAMPYDLPMQPVWLAYFDAFNNNRVLIENSTDPHWNTAAFGNCDLHLPSSSDGVQRLVVAMESHGQPIGVLHLCLRLPAIFTPAMIEMAVEVADQLAISLQQDSLLDQTQRRLHELTVLHEIALLLNDQNDQHDPLRELTMRIAHLLDARRCALLLRDEQDVFRAYNPAYGFDHVNTNALVWKPQPQEADSPLLSKVYMVTKDDENLDKVTGEIIDTFKLSNLLAVSLWRDNQVLGLLVACDKVGGFHSQDIQLLTVVGSHAAQLIINTHLFRQLSDAYDATIAGWSKALELREKETQNHSERVRTLAMLLAQRMGMSEADQSDFSRGVLLHDIGKMGIPDDILLKPGPLDSEQWAIMRTHPRMAYNLLKDIAFLQPALQVPYSHHERWDGSGYPQGLQGEQIPFAARLFAVVDVWDALTNDRPYRPAWSADETKAYLRDNAGVLFDPRVVAVFLDIIASD